MKVLDARFVTSATDAGAIPKDGVPHIALVGRSNVGKSSVINALTRLKLARTSAAPGKTRLANLYRISVEGGPGGPGRWAVYLADLPGYGYARGGDQSVAALRKIAETYFSGSAQLKSRATDAGDDRVARNSSATRRDLDAGHPSGDRVARHSRSASYEIAGALLLVDARHPGLEADADAMAWLSSLGIARAVVATKFDKLSRAERARNLKTLERTLGMSALPVSAASGEGLDDLWTLIARLSRRR